MKHLGRPRHTDCSNEVPTVILIAAVFLVVCSVSWLGGVAGILGVALTLTIAVRMYKNLRERKG